jgi:flavin-dependent dehydrogenase
LFVLGDAAGYVEPFTGEGMAWAFAGAEAVVPYVKQAAASPGLDVDRAWAREYAATIGREQRLCRLIAHGLRHPFLVTPIMGLLGRHPGLAAPVLAHFSARLHPAPERSS